MQISERTLKNWRREALEDTVKPVCKVSDINSSIAVEHDTLFDRLQKRILQMTQILLDQHLLNKGK